MGADTSPRTPRPNHHLERAPTPSTLRRIRRALQQSSTPSRNPATSTQRRCRRHPDWQRPTDPTSHHLRRTHQPIPASCLNQPLVNRTKRKHQLQRAQRQLILGQNPSESPLITPYDFPASSGTRPWPATADFSHPRLPGPCSDRWKSPTHRWNSPPLRQSRSSGLATKGKVGCLRAIADTFRSSLLIRIHCHESKSSIVAPGLPRSNANDVYNAAAIDTHRQSSIN